jgi:phosphoribosylformylglycinamidine synthase II
VGAALSSSAVRLAFLPLTSVIEQPLHRALGLTDWEYSRICALLDRSPNDFELAVFSLLWSEHCGYKHSARLLKRLPTSGPAVLQGPGENAGVVDVGKGLAAAFKVESHNHPSAVEPYQGAATGVGGILRDVSAMGARPVALLDSLRFGPLADERQRRMLARAVAGIGGYGNSVGVPNIGGEVVLDERYAQNCLVNAMCVGLLPRERLTRAGMSGPGNLVVLYGATTGRDGIGGASVLASQELSGEDEDKRPSVQVGDPFTGNKLIDASLELVERNLVESLQDCGAAGISSSLAEMASRGGAGVDVHLDLVPQREPGMTPVELMISESQERMICVVSPDRLAEVEAVCRKWKLSFAQIGAVTDSGRLRCFFDGELVGDIPARLLTEECPRYRLKVRPRTLDEPLAAPSPSASPDQLLRLLRSDNVASRAWVYGQYDCLVQSRTVRRPGLDAGVLRLRPSFRGLAVTLDGAGRLAYLDPRAGGALAVLEAARNVACAGGRPLAFTDCLNFGSPEKPEVAWELAEAIEGMALACEALGVPVVSGNVSLYNETDGRAIYPTPVVGCVGLVEDVRRVPSRWQEGDVIVVAGAPELRLDGSEYQAVVLGATAGRPPMPRLDAEAALIEFVWRTAPSASLVHDAAEGGLAVALVEAALHSGAGAELDLSWDATELFGEGGGQAVVALSADAADRLETEVPLRRIGVAGGDRLLGIPLADLRRAYEGALPEAMI